MIVGPFYLSPRVQANLLRAARADIAANAKRRSQRDLKAALKPVHVWSFQREQQAGHTDQAIALRNGRHAHPFPTMRF